MTMNLAHPIVSIKTSEKIIDLLRSAGFKSHISLGEGLSKSILTIAMDDNAFWLNKSVPRNTQVVDLDTVQVLILLPNLSTRLQYLVAEGFIHKDSRVVKGIHDDFDL